MQRRGVTRGGRTDVGPPGIRAVRRGVTGGLGAGGVEHDEGSLATRGPRKFRSESTVWEFLPAG